VIHPRYWIKHSITRRALRGYPLYDLPHKQLESATTKAEAQENFDYFMSVRLHRLAHFSEWLRKKFSVNATLNGEGLTAVSNWADDYGGGLIQYEGSVALEIWANYRPIWDTAYSGFNVMIDIGIFQGEYLLKKRPKLYWEIYRGREVEPATYGSIHFMKPCLGGFPRFWNGFPLRAGAAAIINGRGLATVGNHLARNGSLVLDAKQNLHLSNFIDGNDPLVVGDYRNEQL
jgi:hypothetical protein